MTETPAPADPTGPRRRLLRCGAGLGLGLAGLGAGCGTRLPNPLAPLTAFGPPLPDVAGANEGLSLPAGYTAEVVARVGEPLGRPGGAQPAPAADPAIRVGAAPAGLAYMPLAGSKRGMLCLGHAIAPAGAGETTARLQALQGVSLLEVALEHGRWEIVRPSPLGRRLTPATPLVLSGPAAGHPLLKTAADPSGARVLGTFGVGPVAPTPWGTFLCGERDFAAAFTTADQPTAAERRFGLQRTPPLDWHQGEARFDTVRHPNEPHRHGWIVEIDPARPQVAAAKRTALGRGAHGAVVAAVQPDGRAVVYRGEAQPQEYLYKFVSRGKAADGAPALLDEGQLYVARLEADGTGQWLALSAAPEGADGPGDAGAVLVQARQAAGRLGASRLGACTGLAGGDEAGSVLVALAATPGQAGGRLLRLREGREPERFAWNAVALPEGLATGPEALAVDGRGRLWLGGGEPAPGGLSSDPNAATARGAESASPSRSGRPRTTAITWLAGDAPGRPVRRFLAAGGAAGPGGIGWTPDGRTLFLNLGPRTLAVRRRDGGPIGS